MDVPTVYVDEPEDGGEARRQLARLLPQLTALFSLIAAATDAQDELHHLYHAAVLGQELSEEATARAETLSDFVSLDRNTTTGEHEAEQSATATEAREEVSCGNS